MSGAPEVKIAKAPPAGATAVGEAAYSDRLTKVDGVRKAALERAGFGGKVGETLVLPDGDKARVLVGLGAAKQVDHDALRRGAAAFARAVSRHRRAAFVLPLDLEVDLEAGVRAVAEGLALGAYRFDVYNTRSGDRPSTGAFHVVVGDDLVRPLRPALERGVATVAAVWFARDLVNEPGGTLTPTVFAERAAERAVEAGLTAEVLDEAAIVEAGLGGIIAVNQGSDEPARLLKLTYEPTTAVDVDDVAAVDGPEPDAFDTVALVGKGITFDSGGLSLKPADSMMDMKCDMAGAAAVIGAMTALPALDARVRVVGFTPMTDNMTGGAAQRPGDVYAARNGTTVEVLNTDAEGRLILADALALAGEEEPDAIVDLATLTGACMVALGQRIAGLMGNDDEFSERVVGAAARAGERVWHLPLPADYRKELDSPVADLKNIGSRYGGALTAGLFLQEFVPEGTPWVHLDIAGPAFASEPNGENPKGGTGFGVRTLLSLLETWGVHDETAEGDEDAEDESA